MTNPFEHPREKEIYGLFNDSFPPILDGVTLAVENYAHWLAEKGGTPCVVTPWNPESSPHRYPVMRFLSFPIRSRHPYRYGYPRLDPFIWKRLRDTDFQILHSHCPFSSGRLAVYLKKKKGIPLVGTFHSKYKEDLKHSFRNSPWFVDIIMKRILNFFNSCDEVWIPQSQVEETVREYGYRGPLTVVENGNDFSEIITGDLWQFKRDARKQLGIPDGCTSLLFVGQHIWEKGIGLILETLGKLSEQRMDFRMNFIGTGYAFDEIQNRLNALGLGEKVRMHGVIKDRQTLSLYYAASDLFLFPSFYDNAPLVVREAAAMGTPSILLEGSTASEVVRDGMNGFLSQNSVGQLAEMVRYVKDNPEKLRSVSENARETLVRSWEDVVGEVMDRYRVIINSNRR